MQACDMSGYLEEWNKTHYYLLLMTWRDVKNQKMDV